MQLSHTKCNYWWTDVSWCHIPTALECPRTVTPPLGSCASTDCSLEKQLFLRTSSKLQVFIFRASFIFPCPFSMDYSSITPKPIDSTWCVIRLLQAVMKRTPCHGYNHRLYTQLMWMLLSAGCFLCYPTCMSQMYSSVQGWDLLVQRQWDIQLQMGQ